MELFWFYHFVGGDHRVDVVATIPADVYGKCGDAFSLKVVVLGVIGTPTNKVCVFIRWAVADVVIITIGTTAIGNGPEIVFDACLRATPAGTRAIVDGAIFANLLQTLFFKHRGSMGTADGNNTVTGLGPSRVTGGPAATARVILATISVASLFTYEFAS